MHFARLIRAKARLGQSISRAHTLEMQKTRPGDFRPFTGALGVGGHLALHASSGAEPPLFNYPRWHKHVYSITISFLLAVISYPPSWTFIVPLRTNSIYLISSCSQTVSSFIQDGCLSGNFNILHLNQMNQICNVLTECTIFLMISFYFQLWSNALQVKSHDPGIC